MREQQVKNEDRGAGSHDLIGRNEKAKNSGWKVCLCPLLLATFVVRYTQNNCTYTVTFHQMHY
jgi:hypothetical protein